MAKKKVLQQVARKVITRSNPKSFVSEQYKTLRTNINFSMPKNELQTILVTSSSPGEGKSTTSSNLAVVFAQEGKRVVLVDADMRKPTAHYTFHVTNTLGLSNLLTRQSSIEETVKETGVQGLDIITSGPIPPNPAELLTSISMDLLIPELKKRYDIILFDAPPTLSVTDAQVLSNKCEGTIFVVNSKETNKDNAVKAKELLISAKAHILGVVINNFELNKDQNYYQYYGSEE
ncbi:CpsD/CapB family tyrosine-protein kinase [Paenisporosarcina quisquiliarum]|uniref:non-specific protein-tyrosine kinase n=1 Tax=Paenisporosarcina quisquiliarum TaxID=365346 RepID=A0A9X3LFV8_9BACL|nr:CpsD/CapB family tyrosine-protein kinase [Paenisporosarcina quisquiliarum]MCZ8537245.1 CpsD/CapB family tyrosine-protein kinase [Paenisporosarcina quisquiliarum]